MHTRLIVITTTVLLAIASLEHATAPGRAQSGDPPLVPGRNVNMVAGLTLPGGDPHLQRQDEPAMAVSTRNSVHLMAAANDYRTVDIPGLPEDRVTGDSWLGIFKSFDGGLSWQSTLLPGFPQDTSPEGMVSPLKGYAAAADPTLRAGPNGMFYLNGIAFNRGVNALGVVFVSRFIDLNNKEGVAFQVGRDPVKGLGTVVVDSGTSGQFTDKPWLAVDVPRPGASTSNLVVRDDDAPGGQVLQDFPCGNAYLTYAIFLGETRKNARSKIMFSKTADCGATWGKPQMINESYRISQGTTIAVAPANGDIHLAWRQFKAESEPDAIVVAKSTDGGKKFTKAVEAAQISSPFDQPTLPAPSIPGLRSFRTNTFPTMAVDGTGRVYMAWTELGWGPSGEARIVLTTSPDGLTWSTPKPIDNHPGRGHQIMPAMTIAAGKPTVLYYDFRDDVWPDVSFPIADVIALEPPPIGPVRHSVDVRIAQADPGADPVFGPSTKVSRYMTTAVPTGTTNGVLTWDFLQLQLNAPNLPLFAGGADPFIGDYIDLAASPALIPTAGGWRFNTEPGDPELLHATWTENRDVAPPADLDWVNYTPPGQVTASPCAVDKTGMRNQNIYTARISRGLVAGTLGNSKDLLLARRSAFALFVQNEADTPRDYRLDILNQPAGGMASFSETAPQLSLTVTGIPPYSGFVRTLYATSSDPRATITIRATDTATGVTSDIVLNPDPTNPPLVKELQPGEEIHSSIIVNRDIQPWPSLLVTNAAGELVLNPDLYQIPEFLNPALLNPALLNPALLNPALLNPALLNPALLNPALLNPALLNPALLNPALLNPALLNPALLNPALLNPALLNPALLNATLTDTTWTVKNVGNTASGYAFAPVTATGLPTGSDGRAQLLIYRAYKTPFDNNCQLTEEGVQYEMLANILDPVVIDPANPALLNPALLNQALGVSTFRMAPTEEIFITLRVLDTNGGVYDPTETAGVLASQAPNTDGSAPPRADQTITFGPLPDRSFGDPPFAVSATASSGLPVTFTASGNCTVSGKTVTITGAGSCTITASQAGSVNYNPASPVPQSFQITKADQTITFDPLPDKIFGDPPFAITATASSGLPVTFTASGDCTVSGNTVTITGAGSCTITASQGGDANYNPAPPVSQSLQIARADQAITFDPLPDRSLGETFTLVATASSGLPVTFTSLTPSACTVAGSTVTIVGGGTCTIEASQAGNADYNPAAPVSRSFNVLYNFTGFMPPLGPADSPSVYGPFNLGNTIPLKWQLTDGNGGFIRALSTVVSLQAARLPGCPAEPPAPRFTLYPLATGGTELRYDLGNEQFVFNWDTAGLQTGCYRLYLKLDDGSERFANVELK